MSAPGIHAWQTTGDEIQDDLVSREITSTCDKCNAQKKLHVDLAGNLLDPTEHNPLSGCPN